MIDTVAFTHSHCEHGSHGSHGQHHCMTHPPYVHFEEEPPLLREQVEVLGGYSIRHRFAERGYNPGLVENRWTHPLFAADYLMTYRSQAVSDHISVSTLNLCGVDKRGNVLWDIPLKLPSIAGEGEAMMEDGRLIWSGEQLYLVYSNVRLWDTGVKFKQSLVPLTPVPAKVPYVLSGHAVSLPFGKNVASLPHHEKNWQFFMRGKGRETVSFCEAVGTSWN